MKIDLEKLTPKAQQYFANLAYCWMDIADEEPEENSDDETGIRTDESTLSMILEICADIEALSDGGYTVDLIKQLITANEAARVRFLELMEELITGPKQ